MKKKLFIISLALFALATIGVVIDFSNTQCSHSLDGHNCSEHLTQVRNADERCPTCFSGYDDYNLCPICDYEYCVGCGNQSLIKVENFCRQCGYSPIAVCKNCGEEIYKCTCEFPSY